MKKNRLIVYDLDGTLIDSAGVVTLLLNDLRKDLGKEPLLEKDLVPWLSLGGKYLMQHALEIKASQSQYFLNIFRERYHDTPTPGSSVFKGVKDCLNLLSESNYFLAISTNKPRSLAEKVLSETGLIQYFGCVNAGGDLINKKPHVSNLLFCQNYFDVKNDQTFFVGDSKVDQELAFSGKVPFIFYESGYNDGVNKEKVFAILKQHQDLPGILN
jgi:phosphoglycolate phosphatase